MKKIFLIAIVTVLISACATKKHYSAQEERQRLEYAKQIMDNDPEYKTVKSVTREATENFLKTENIQRLMPAHLYENLDARACGKKFYDKTMKSITESSLSMAHLTSLMKEFDTEELAQMAAYSSSNQMHIIPELQARYKKALYAQLSEDESPQGVKKIAGMSQCLLKKICLNFSNA